MARKKRQEVPGGVFHVYSRGCDRRRIYVDDWDYLRYVETLAATVARYRWLCLGYCLMPNHMHLLIETPEPNLGLGMKMLHGEYAIEFNRLHGRRGHLFESRFNSSLITTEARFVRLVSYVALNPVAAQLCSLPEEWPWSSHLGIVSNRAPGWLATERLFGYLGADSPSGRQHYEDTVDTGLMALRAGAYD